MWDGWMGEGRVLRRRWSQGGSRLERKWLVVIVEVYEGEKAVVTGNVGDSVVNGGKGEVVL